jgi:hypothetical protein
MILLSPVADSPDLADTACPKCRTCFPIPCVPRVNTCEGLDSLIAGTLNTAPCPSCGTLVTSDRPVHIDMPELGIGYMRFTPLDMLDDDSVCQLMLVDNHYQLVFYSLDELARQVQARIRLSQVSFNGPKADD